MYNPQNAPFVLVSSTACRNKLVAELDRRKILTKGRRTKVATLPIEDNFYDAGETIKGFEGGDMTADYRDIGGPPPHPDCRYYIRPENSEI